MTSITCISVARRLPGGGVASARGRCVCVCGRPDVFFLVQLDQKAALSVSLSMMEPCVTEHIRFRGIRSLVYWTLSLPALSPSHRNWDRQACGSNGGFMSAPFFSSASLEGGLVQHWFVFFISCGAANIDFASPIIGLCIFSSAWAEVSRCCDYTLCCSCVPLRFL